MRFLAARADKPGRAPTGDKPLARKPVARKAVVLAVVHRAAGFGIARKIADHKAAGFAAVRMALARKAAQLNPAHSVEGSHLVRAFPEKRVSAPAKSSVRFPAVPRSVLPVVSQVSPSEVYLSNGKNHFENLLWQSPLSFFSIIVQDFAFAVNTRFGLSFWAVCRNAGVFVVFPGKV